MILNIILLTASLVLFSITIVKQSRIFKNDHADRLKLVFMIFNILLVISSMICINVILLNENLSIVNYINTRSILRYYFTGQSIVLFALSLIAFGTYQGWSFRITFKKNKKE